MRAAKLLAKECMMADNSQVRQAALSSRRIDTHAHLMGEYAGLEEEAAAYEHFATTHEVICSRIVAEVCRILYGIDPGAFLRPDAPEELFRKAAELRKMGPWETLNCVMDQVGITKQLAFCDHTKESRPYADHPQNQKLAYLAYLDPAVSGHWQYPCPDLDDSDICYYENLCELFGPLGGLDDYLDALDESIDDWRSRGVVGMKSSIAYTSGLAVADPTRTEAQAAFARKKDMTYQDFLIVHDYAFRHGLDACKRNSLPAVFHTGFQIWGHADLAQSNPMGLHNLLIDPRYRDLTFVLLHGGNPYVGETTYLAGMFQNVIIDFTWISWMQPGRFSRALTEWLEVVPHDRFCWGSDSKSPETIAGIDSITRRGIADVTAEAVASGIIDEKYALEFIDNTYLNTPKRVFGL